MFDLLPKFEVLRRAGWNDERIDYYVLNDYQASFQRETLQRLGIPEKKLIVAPGRLISADRALIPSRVRNGFLTPPWIRDFINQNFTNKKTVGSHRPDGPSRLYISRVGADRRRLLNEEAVRTIVERRGFQTVLAEQHSVAEFSDMVCNAQQIVAPHGAGATNVVFAKPNVRFLELYGGHIAPEAWLMTNIVGGRFYLLAGQDALGRYPWADGAYGGLSAFEKNLADYSVDPQDLERALERLASD